MSRTESSGSAAEATKAIGSRSTAPSSVRRDSRAGSPRSTVRAGKAGVMTQPIVAPVAGASASAFNAVSPPSPGTFLTWISTFPRGFPRGPPRWRPMNEAKERAIASPLEPADAPVIIVRKRRACVSLWARKGTPRIVAPKVVVPRLARKERRPVKPGALSWSPAFPPPPCRAADGSHRGTAGLAPR